MAACHYAETTPAAAPAAAAGPEPSPFLATLALMR